MQHLPSSSTWENQYEIPQAALKLVQNEFVINHWRQVSANPNH